MAVHLTESDFYIQQQNADNKWRIAAPVAVGLHVILLVWSFLLPDMFDQKPLLDEFVTVDLVSMPEPQALPEIATPPPSKQPEVEQPPQPPPEEAAQPDPDEVEIPLESEVVPDPVVEAKPISVKPLKRKIKKAVDTRLAEEKEREKRALHCAKKSISESEMSSWRENKSKRLLLPEKRLRLHELNKQEKKLISPPKMREEPWRRCIVAKAHWKQKIQPLLQAVPETLLGVRCSQLLPSNTMLPSIRIYKDTGCCPICASGIATLRRQLSW